MAVNFIPNEFLDTSQRNIGSLLVITHLFSTKIIEIKKNYEKKYQAENTVSH